MAENLPQLPLRVTKAIEQYHQACRYLNGDEMRKAHAELVAAIAEAIKKD